MDQPHIYHFYNDVEDIETSEPYSTLTDTQIITAINTLFQLHYDCVINLGPWFVNSSDSPYDGSYIAYGECLMQALQHARERKLKDKVVLPQDRFRRLMDTFSRAWEFKEFCWEALN